MSPVLSGFFIINWNVKDVNFAMYLIVNIFGVGAFSFFFYFGVHLKTSINPILGVISELRGEFLGFMSELGLKSFDFRL